MKISKKVAEAMMVVGVGGFLGSFALSSYFIHKANTSPEQRRLSEIVDEQIFIRSEFDGSCDIRWGTFPPRCKSLAERYRSLVSESYEIKYSPAYVRLQKETRDWYLGGLLGVGGFLSFGAIGVAACERRDKEEEAKNKPKIEETKSKNRIEVSADLQARIEDADPEAAFQAELEDFDERFKEKYGKPKL